MTYLLVALSPQYEISLCRLSCFIRNDEFSRLEGTPEVMKNNTFLLNFSKMVSGSQLGYFL